MEETIRITITGFDEQVVVRIRLIDSIVGIIIKIEIEFHWFVILTALSAFKFLIIIAFICYHLTAILGNSDRILVGHVVTTKVNRRNFYK